MNKYDTSQRGVLYVGYKCNLDCGFCYYRHLPSEKKGWSPLGTCVKKAQYLRIYYGNTFVDITGGEPTIYPQILSLVRYCRSIGLLPTCITNAQALADKRLCQEFKKAGIHDLLVSIHGLDSVYDNFVGKEGASETQIVALDNLASEGIPFRFNVVLLEEIAAQLGQILEIVQTYHVPIVNLIMFNLFESWRTIEGFPKAESLNFRYSLMAPHIKEFIEKARELGVEVNIRYFPFCRLKGYEGHVYNWQQLPYDPHEWDINSWYDGKVVDPKPEWYDKKILELNVKGKGYKKTSACDSCALTQICDGFNDLYVERYNSEEIDPYEGNEIESPTNFLDIPKKSPFYFKGSSTDAPMEEPFPLSLESLAENKPIENDSILVSPDLETHTKFTLGICTPPYILEARVSGPAGQIGFSFGECQDFCVELPDNDPHNLRLEVSSNGKIRHLVDGEEKMGSRRDLGNLSVCPPAFIEEGPVYLKTRQSLVKIHSISLSRQRKDELGASVLVVSMGYARRLGILLRSLSKQTVTGFEVLVGYDKTRDDTAWVIESIRRDFGLRVRGFDFSDFSWKGCKADVMNTLLRQSRGDFVLITDADIVMPPDIIDHLLQARDMPHLSTKRCLLPAEETSKILLGERDPIRHFDDTLREYEDRITKWGDIARKYEEEPALGYFQWVQGDLARRIGYPNKWRKFSGSDDSFSLAILRELGLVEVPLIDKTVLHLDHGPSNWKGLGGNKWL